MRRVSIKYRYLMWMVLMFSCFAGGMVLWINHQMKIQGMREAHDKARIILDRNLATHRYFSDHLKPSVYKLLDADVAKTYFDPAWMSSSYAVRVIGDYFKEFASQPYAYKECALNARNPLNEADAFESEIFKLIRRAPEETQWEGIRTFDEERYYVLIRRSEVMTEACLKCHGAPGDAPLDLISLYGKERGFHCPMGELLSVASIRIPVEAAYQNANHVTRHIFTGFAVMMVVLLGGVHLLNTRFFVSPLAYFTNRSRAVAKGNMGDDDSSVDHRLAGEWRVLKTAFDDMTAHIARHEIDLNEKIKKAVVEVEEKHRTLEEEIVAHRETTLKLKRESDIIKNINVGLYIYRLEDLQDDSTLVLIDANPATEAMTGLSCGEIIGKRLEDHFPAARRHGLPQLYADVVRTGRPVEIGDFYVEESWIGPGWRHVSAFPLPDQCMGVSFSNITLRKRMEEDLAKEKNNLQALFEHMLNAFAVHRIILDDSGVPIDYLFLDVNPAFERFTGLKREDILGKRVTEVHPGIDKMEFDWIGAYGRVALTGEPIQFEQYFEPHDHWYHVAAYRPMPLHFVVTFQDITERKKSENEKKTLGAQLRQAQKLEAIGVLAGGIAHDFNNILFPIIGFAEMVRDDLGEESPIRENVEEIIGGALRARDLVRQILAFSRQEEGTLKPIHVQLIAKEVLRLIRSTLPSTISIQQFIDPGCGVILNDPTRIHQLIMNLITNAFHAMEEKGGILSLQVTPTTLDEAKALSMNIEPGDYVWIMVSDTGVGMDPVILQKMFDPYFTTKGEGKGTGLGLSVVYGIVKAAAGGITVSSRKDEGTCFDIYFPVYSPPFLSETQPDEHPQFKGEAHVLLIDDEYPVLKIGKQILERLGCRVTGRTSSIEALELFKNRPDDFQVIFTDMTMPNMTGDTLAKEIKRIRPQIPVILCTGYSSRMNAARAAELGIDAFIYKPILSTEVSRTLYEVLSKTTASPLQGDI